MARQAILMDGLASSQRMGKMMGNDGKMMEHVNQCLKLAAKQVYVALSNAIQETTNAAVLPDIVLQIRNERFPLVNRHHPVLHWWHFSRSPKEEGLNGWTNGQTVRRNATTQRLRGAESPWLPAGGSSSGSERKFLAECQRTGMGPDSRPLWANL